MFIFVKLENLIQYQLLPEILKNQYSYVELYKFIIPLFYVNYEFYTRQSADFRFQNMISIKYIVKNQFLK